MVPEPCFAGRSHSHSPVWHGCVQLLAASATTGKRAVTKKAAGKTMVWPKEAHEERRTKNECGLGTWRTDRRKHPNFCRKKTTMYRRGTDTHLSPIRRWGPTNTVPVCGRRGFGAPPLHRIASLRGGMPGFGRCRTFGRAQERRPCTMDTYVPGQPSLSLTVRVCRPTISSVGSKSSRTYHQDCVGVR